MPMSAASRAPIAALCTALALAACGRAEPPAVREHDPLLISALNEALMIDPDLAGQNRANSAAAFPSQDGTLPSIDNNPEAVAAAREEALRLVGGPGKMRQAPEPRDASGFTAEIAAGPCANRAQRSAAWAARMPAPFPVYPRAAVQDAAGTDVADCALRFVTFITPVPVDDVADFYFTRARAAGFSADRLLADGDDVLSGSKGPSSYLLYARRQPSGNSEVVLVTRG